MKPEESPAPACTFTVAPSPESFLAVSGVIATRVSTAGSSRVVAMIISRSKQREDQEEKHQDGRNGAPGKHRRKGTDHSRDDRQDESQKRPAARVLDTPDRDDDNHAQHEGDRHFREAREALEGSLVLGVVHIWS